MENEFVICSNNSICSCNCSGLFKLIAKLFKRKKRIYYGNEYIKFD